MVLEFPNLSGDAYMIVPAKYAHVQYTSLASFVRHAPDDQADALFLQTGMAVLSRLNDEPLWLSTAGMGVPWLHIRLDSRPKYYKYPPYKALPE